MVHLSVKKISQGLKKYYYRFWRRDNKLAQYQTIESSIKLLFFLFSLVKIHQYSMQAAFRRVQYENFISDYRLFDHLKGRKNIIHKFYEVHC